MLKHSTRQSDDQSLSAVTCRGRPMRTGCNSTAKAIVHSSAQRHQLAHARHAWIARRPHASERGPGGHGAEYHRSGQRRLQQAGFSGAPRHDIVDLERDTPTPSSRGSAMMFAKLSERPSSAQISSVRTPASRSGISLSSTSVKRRSAIRSRIAIAPIARMPASVKADMTVLAAS